MMIVAVVIAVGIVIGLTYMSADQAFKSAEWLRFRCDLRNAFRPKSDPLVIAKLEHELGVSGHRPDTCTQCKPTLRMPARFSKGGVIVGPTKPIRLVPECSPGGSGNLSVVYADECFLSRDGICVRRDDFHESAKIKADRWWICPLHD